MDPKKIGMRRERKRVPRACKSVLAKRRASRAMLTTSFSQNCQALAPDLLGGFSIYPSDLPTLNRPLDHIDRFALRFVIDSCHHFTEQAHAHQLHPKNQEEDREQQERSSADLLTHDQFETGQIQE